MSGTWFYPKIWDETSAMEFSTPEMEATSSGTTYDMHWTATSTTSRHPAVWDCVLSAIRVDHATVGVLSDSTPALANCISTAFCSNEYCKRTAAICNSELIRQPYGL